MMNGVPTSTVPRVRTSAALMASALVLYSCLCVQAAWKPADGPLMTKWSAEVSPDNVWPEYPRPQMVRRDWLNLNGLWDYAITAKDRMQPRDFDGQILVPFPVESALSGVMKRVGPDNRLWYRRTFEIPRGRRGHVTGRRILIHFGAVDWDTTVWVNGLKVGSHRGGYDPFTFDITHAVKAEEPQTIVVSVWDPSDAGTQPRGKQVRKPRGIWYTPVTGIWQTVWIEPVNPFYIESLEMTPDLDAATLKLKVNVEGNVPRTGTYRVMAEVPEQLKLGLPSVPKQMGAADAAIGEELEIPLADPKLWTPDSPHLYDLKVMIARKARETTVTGTGTTTDWEGVDSVQCYFAMRKISIEKDEEGINRLFLNGKPLFQYGPLDQGWWPDGLYTAPADAALRYDVEVTKQLGMNMARKHVKVEPDRWYYWCDKLGLLVWQDMPSGDRYIRRTQPDIVRTKESAEQFELEWSRIIKAFYNHPSIVMWVPFNEGWGQFDTDRIVQMTKDLDPIRLVNNASGWTDRGVGDVHDIHRYPGPACPPLEEDRAVVLGEFGGLGLPVRGHTWQDEKNWGYRSYDNRAELTDAYLALLDNLRPLIGGGLTAAVYTQTSDVEIEVNGLMTYDRAMIKMDTDKVRAAAEKLYLPPPIVTVIVPTSQEDGQIWRYTTTAPASGWQQSDFDDSDWDIGKGGFGTEGTPGAVIGTTWDTPDIWLRRTIDLESTVPSELFLTIHHDEDAEVYINGTRITKLNEHTSGYVRVALDEKALAAFKPGLNKLAVHCHQTRGGQYIDVGFVDIKERPAKK
ncbi:MAG: hypothetical protein JSW27_06865 [Phycisphaerales bacterium]|nr:MAG: hypothetical protein JSW27_06865 [Phycisphaerales bacterium]